MIDFATQGKQSYYDTDVDCVLQQIDMLFTTRYNDVLGADEYGSDYERYLYDLMQSNSDIEKYCFNTIMSNVDLLGFDCDVVCRLLMGNKNDIILLTVTLSKDGTAYEKTYKIE